MQAIPVFLAMMLVSVKPDFAPESIRLGRAPTASTQASTSDAYRNKRYPYRSGAKRAAKPRYYSFKTKRGVTILCKTTWRGSQSTRTCWPRH